jgi:hypothetical protein
MSPKLPLFLSISLSMLLVGGGSSLLGQERSAKRGGGADFLNAEQEELLAPGVSWVYNWGSTPWGSTLGNLELNGLIEYYPMIWRAEQSWLDEVKAYLDSGATPSHVLFSNEPNFVEPLGSFTTPEETADLLATAREAVVMMSRSSAPTWLWVRFLRNP